ncbi:hypothetical protein HDU97_000584 [Phlyctochytrium planicorne]|nr:hypothetical protein HDU97_000584 [Phlyctochytrium planicorne]
MAVSAIAQSSSSTSAAATSSAPTSNIGAPVINTGAPTSTAAAPAPVGTQLITIIEPFTGATFNTGDNLKVSWVAVEGQNVQQTDTITWRWEDITKGPNTGVPFGDPIHTGPVSERGFTIVVPALKSGSWGLRAELASFPAQFQYSPSFTINGGAATSSAPKTTAAVTSVATSSTAAPKTTSAPSSGYRSFLAPILAAVPALAVLFA